MLIIDTDPLVYGPREDTYVLVRALEHEDFSGCGLEIGTGTGIIALTVCCHFKKFVGVDINLRAVALARENARANNIENVQFIESNLFSRVSGQYDVIIFNPPYVPADENIAGIEDLSYHGGEDGRRMIDEFLLTFKDYLNPGGKVYLLQSSLSDIQRTSIILRKKKFSYEIIARKPLFFEELVVFKIYKEKEGLYDQTGRDH
jgi:release factor glutamine methyltransferase